MPVMYVSDMADKWIETTAKAQQRPKATIVDMLIELADACRTAATDDLRNRIDSVKRTGVVTGTDPFSTARAPRIENTKGPADDGTK